MIRKPLLAVALGVAATVGAQTAPLFVRAPRAFPMDGPPVDDAAIVIEDGRITAFGSGLEPPPGAEVHAFDHGVMMPGFVELHCHVGVPQGGDINDSVLPHNMELRTLDLLMQDSPELERAMRSGVTTVLVIPGSGSTIGGLGTLIKTAGPSFDERLVRFPGALKIALHARGGNPARRAGDLGYGRLGLHHMLKVVLRDARDYHEAWSAWERGESATKPEFNPRLDPLRGLWRHEFPIIFHAYGQNDTMTAVRVALWELGADMIISHGVYDSFKIADVLASTGVPMNIGPRQYEFDESEFVGNAAALQAAGVPVSICTDAPVVAQDQLQLQAAMAVRMGLPVECALRGLTIENARAVGIADRVGSLTVGKDGDVVVFPGDPLDPRNAPLLVVVDGRVTSDRSRD
ncbi:MAG: amidohydrolase family protein [Planctomycetes bacterium]|nr:amidohydrolase family protein [Planctomycetota bacterium]